MWGGQPFGGVPTVCGLALRSWSCNAETSLITSGPVRSSFTMICLGEHFGRRALVFCTVSRGRPLYPCFAPRPGLESFMSRGPRGARTKLRCKRFPNTTVARSSGTNANRGPAISRGTGSPDTSVIVPMSLKSFEVVTQGEHGCTVYRHGMHAIYVPTKPAVRNSTAIFNAKHQSCCADQAEHC